jgi:pimeloyl-ACP methyl ester carboxylesterase
VRPGPRESEGSAMTLFDGITARLVETPRLSVRVLERAGDRDDAPAEETVVLLHDTLTSAVLWQETMLALPGELRILAIDLRGFGGSENLPVDARRGVRDFADDLAALTETLGLPPVHLVGWGLGGAVALQFALQHPVRSITLEAPLSPYGFGGTRRDGSRLTDDDAGCGAGIAHPDLVQRLTRGDAGDEAETSPRSVFRSEFVASGYTSAHEDVWIDAMLATSTAAGNYPGDAVPSPHWPGWAAGTTGVLNATAPGNLDLSAIVQLEPKPPILWVRGELDTMISDTSLTDVNHLGALGIVPEWPGAETAPAQPMVSQTRDVLAAYVAAGGDAVEVAIPGVGHSPHLESPAVFRSALLSRIGYLGTPADPAPPTEAIIIRSAD